MPVPRYKLLVCFLLLGAGLPAQLHWKSAQQFSGGLPEGIQVFETHDTLEAGFPFHATYVRARLGDDQLDFSTSMATDAPLTPLELAEDELYATGDSVYVAINGGYFSATGSVSLIIRDGHLLAPGLRSVNRSFGARDTTYFPTRGAFGIGYDGVPDIGWVYTDTSEVTYAYSHLAPNFLDAAPAAAPSPTDGKLWEMEQAIGGAPVLVQNGAVMVTDTEELIDVGNDEREPRTAIGYTVAGELILLVVDGRQEGYASGATLKELAQIMVDLGCREALNLDGGGSSAMIVNGKTASSPSDAEGLRPVRSALLIKQKRTDGSGAYRPPTQRGDTRMAIVSDFNAGFGSATYEWQVDSLMQRIPRLWSPDLVVCGGDMVAGQSSALTPGRVDTMWQGFDRSIATPIREAGIPFVFTLGNHDGSISVDSAAARRYWNNPAHFPGWVPVDTSNYPFYMSFLDKPEGGNFFIAWNAADASLSEQEIEWVRRQLDSDLARDARFRFVVGHLPLYPVANERNSAGNILGNAEALRALLEEKQVHTYISGHHHAFYPGKRGKLELMNAGAAGSGPRSVIGTNTPSPNTVTILDVFTADNAAFGKDTIIYTTYETQFREEKDMRVVNDRRLPELLPGFGGTYQIRRDLGITDSMARELISLQLTEPFSRTGFSNGHGITVDGNGRIWAGAFSGGLRVTNPDSTNYILPSKQLTYSTEGKPYLLSFTWKGSEIAARGIRGMGTAMDGNPLIVFNNSDLYKFDAVTGEPLAHWAGPTSLTNPSVDASGRIFMASVTGNSGFLLRESGVDSFTLAIPEFALAGRPSVVRAAAISRDGRMLFLPNAGGRNVNRYVQNDFFEYIYTDTIATVNGSNSITTDTAGGVYILANRGISPPELIYQNYSPGNTREAWQLALDKIRSTDLRGIALSRDGRFIYVIGSSEGRVERYEINRR